MNKRLWEDAIALNSQDEPVFEVLPPAAQLTDRVSWTVDPEKIGLAHPLDYYLSLDTSPLPLPVDREGYFGDRHFEYWLSGLQTATVTRDLVARYGAGTGCYVELGSASGRVIRHLAYDSAFQQNWAFDINWRHIAWINRFLPKNILAVQNNSIPSLPLEDRSVDCISAMSVFTHVDVFELHWLAELRRTLKPGGIALITVVTDHQLRNMTDKWPMWKPFTSHPRWSSTILEELRKVGKMSFRWHTDRSYGANVVYDVGHIKELLGRFFNVLEYRHQFPDYQDFIVLQRP